VEHAFWLGHPSHADALPALDDWGPTHPSFAPSGGFSLLSFVILDVDWLID